MRQVEHLGIEVVNEPKPAGVNEGRDVVRHALELSQRIVRVVLLVVDNLGPGGASSVDGVALVRPDGGILSADEDLVGYELSNHVLENGQSGGEADRGRGRRAGQRRALEVELGGGGSVAPDDES